MKSVVKRTSVQLVVCLLLAANTQANADNFTTDLALPADGNYAAGSFPFVTTGQSFGGATFDIVYTLSAVSNDTGALVGVDGGLVGVGSDNDVNPQHYTTVEGDGAGGAGGEGLSITGLSIANFQANGSGLTVADITDLQFNGLTLSAVANNQDGADISFTGFGASTANVLLASGGTGGLNVYEIPLTSLANFSSTATGLYIEPDNTASSNRWNVTGISVTFDIPAQRDITNPLQGLRADWMRGAWGALWLPKNKFNGNIEGVTIDAFLTQIADLQTIDFVQVPLCNPNIFSPVHSGPHDIIESLWQGDTDNNGDPINLVVPRASAPDPLLSWLKAIDAAGLRSEIYSNSYNLLARIPENIPSDYPDLSARWENWCDTNPTAQAFINSHPYIDAGDPPRRKYMFCYAEFILKEYSLRYGDLIDAWCFDSADNIMEDCGDDADSGELDDQRIYQAFAEACQAGNPHAAISFNNSVGTDVAPLSTPTLFDDYAFGHPFGGAGNMVVPEILYTRNFAICEFMKQHNGLPFGATDNRDWNDNVVAHFFPKQSTTSWSAGNTPCLTNEQFVEWTAEGCINGGAITWGTPLVRQNLENSPVLTLQPYALTQLALVDEHFSAFQYPGRPNFRRADTPLPAAATGSTYNHSLTDGFDFWDPSGGSITNVNLIGQPAWLTVAETSPGSGVWVLSGDPTAAGTYSFDIQILTGTQAASRTVQLEVGGTLPGDFDEDGDVDVDDIDLLSANMGQPASANPDMDLNDDGNITLADHDLHITTMVQTDVGTGALIGDINLDGDVDISQFDPATFTNLGDASILLSNLGTVGGASYGDGDLNGDGDVDISEIDLSTFTNVGDASRLLSNLGQSQAAAASSSSAAPK